MAKKTEVIVKDGVQYEVVRVISKGKSKEELEFEQWSNETYCLEAVKRNGDALSYVKEQTEAVCLEAVKQDGDALRYVKEQTEAVCLEAVKRNGDALRYVKVKTIFFKILKSKQ